MPQLHTTESGNGRTVTAVAGPSDERKHRVIPIDRLMYLQALFPYASFQQLQNIIADTADTDEAASLGYEALNPDYTGLPYLRQQWQLKHDGTVPSTKRKNAFQGISETLLDRADDLFSAGQLVGFSSVREYDATMQLFPIDTSEWDAVHLHASRSPGEYANEALPLTGAEQHSPFTKPQSSQPPSQLQQQSLLNLSEFSFGASGVEMPSQRVLSAPIVRWAPRAIRVSTRQAREAQHEVFRIFDDAAFFSTPLLPFDMSDAPDMHVSTQGHNGVSAISQHDPLEACDAARQPRQTVRSLESHEPVELDEAAVSALPEFVRISPTAEQEEAAMDSTTNTRVMGPRSRTSALVALEEQKNRGAMSTTSQNLQRRMQKLKPLDNTVFQQPDAVTAAAPAADAKAPSPHSAQTGPYRRAAGSSLPETEESGGVRGCDVMPALGYHMETRIKVMSTSAFLEREIQEWDQAINALKPYDGVFDHKNRCELVVQLYDRCPLFVDRLELIVTRILPVIAVELIGKRLSEGLREVPVELPLFGCKLVSTGEIRVRSVVFDVDKCKAAFQDEGCRIRLKAQAKEFSLEPLAFAYIDEVTAARERRKSAQRPKEATRYSAGEGMSASESLNYKTGVTKGTMTIACKRVSVEVVGGAWLLSAGKVFIIVESAKVKLGSLTISSDVKKVNALATLAKPLLKSVLKRQLQSALKGSHPL